MHRCSSGCYLGEVNLLNKKCIQDMRSLNNLLQHIKEVPKENQISKKIWEEEAIEVG